MESTPHSLSPRDPAAPPASDAVLAVKAAHLRYVSDRMPGITRERAGGGFRYRDPAGSIIDDHDELARIAAIAIPPAWTEVWICPHPHGHVQAIGRDARRRKQYRYHPRWREVRDQTKYHRLAGFCRALPRIRAAVARDLARHDLDKRKVVATVVSLMETAQLRVGNDGYTRQNGSYGATTLRDRHVHIRGGTLELAFRAKGGLERRVRVSDRRLARIVRRIRDLPGQRLFQYVDGDGRVRPVTSEDVNAYLHEVSGGPFTAKDYRTWAATCAAALLLCELEPPRAARACKSCVKRVLEQVAARLGHTVAICRSSYVHPRLVEDFTAHRLARELRADVARRLRRAHVREGAISVAALRAVEPAVARYVARA